MKAWVGLLLLLCIPFGGCSPQMMEEDLPKPSDSTEIVIPPVEDDTLIFSVAQAQNYYLQYEKEFVWVQGYIVGCVAGTSLNGAQFTPPFFSETNLLLADKPNETNVALCLPVSLPAQSEFRKELNLVAHSELLGKRITLLGYVEKYFQQAGIKVFHEYYFSSTSNDDEDDSHTETDIDPKPDSTTTIPILNTGEIVQGGRVVRR